MHQTDTATRTGWKGVWKTVPALKADVTVFPAPAHTPNQAPPLPTATHSMVPSYACASKGHQYSDLSVAKLMSAATIPLPLLLPSMPPPPHPTTHSMVPSYTSKGYQYSNLSVARLLTAAIVHIKSPPSCRNATLLAKDSAVVAMTTPLGCSTLTFLRSMTP